MSSASRYVQLSSACHWLRLGDDVHGTQAQAPTAVVEVGLWHGDRSVEARTRSAGLEGLFQRRYHSWYAGPWSAARQLEVLTALTRVARFARLHRPLQRFAPYDDASLLVEVIDRLHRDAHGAA
jgi:hypothetical protein